MKTVFEELPGWTFEIKEKSAGVYEISGIDRQGRSVKLTGTNYDELVSQCKLDAKDIEDK